MSAAGPTIDIVVPVYNAPADVRRCVESVLAHPRDGCRLVLIDDGSPDPAIAAYFAELAARALPDVLLLANERNLGFTATANRGMTQSRHDVILLNSDTLVTRGWVEAMRRCAASDPRIGTITPFSSNAEICSYPRFCADNRFPADGDPEATRAVLAAAAVPTYPDLPTGVGFCLYVRRALIDAVGVFDLAFGAGYGEENDLCLRAARAGWRNVLADDAFVVHTGGRSFEDQKATLSPRNTAILVERHPHYPRMVDDYIRADPLRPLREAAQSRAVVAGSGLRGVLHVLHDHGGGAETYVRALIGGSRGTWRHYLAVAVGDAWQVEEHRADGRVVTFDFCRGADEPWPGFVNALCATFDVALVHLHVMSRCRDGLLAALAALDVPYGYTVHDLYFACPTINFLGPDAMYCGGVTDADVCRRCLAAQPAYAGVDIDDWRARNAATLAGAAFLVAPSRWAAGMLARYFPARAADVIAHGTPDDEAAPPAEPAHALALPDDGVPVVAVIGAIGPDKGARRIERLVALARARGASLRLVLIGYMDVRHAPWQSDDRVFTVHGRYAPSELPRLLEHYRVRIVLYPSAGPETFSYTLSEAWAAGVPALVPPIGALAERVTGSGAGWVMSDDEWRSEPAMLDRLAALLAPGSRALVDDAARAARARPPAPLSGMTAATLAIYERTLSLAQVPAARTPPFDRARIRDALGYRAWSPVTSAPASATPAAPAGDDIPAARVVPLGTRVAIAALALRKTAVGRALRRVAPQVLLDALKARLHS